MEIGLETNLEKAKYAAMFRHQSAWPNLNIKTVDRSCRNVGKFKYLRMTLTNKNTFTEELKSKLRSWNASCHSVQILLKYT
jgi:hypothetical protein